MTQDRISVIDAAQALGLSKQTVFKILTRLGMETFKERNSNHKGQAIAYLAMDSYEQLQTYLESRKPIPADDEDIDLESLGIEFGVFYVIQLEPVHDPGRFKVGFASIIGERLRSHRCAAPFAELLKTWPCKRLWERTAIDCITVGCERLYTEVFRADDLSLVVAKCDEFFNMMPMIVDKGESIGDCDAEQTIGHEALDRPL
jgi:hypothetical protein